MNYLFMTGNLGGGEGLKFQVKKDAAKLLFNKDHWSLFLLVGDISLRRNSVFNVFPVILHRKEYNWIDVLKTQPNVNLYEGKNHLLCTSLL